MVRTFSDKFISDADAEKIKEVFTMTKVDRLLAEDKRKAVEKAVGEAVDETSKKIAQNMLKDGDSVKKVSKNTGLSMSIVKKLLEAVEESSNRVAML